MYPVQADGPEAPADTGARIAETSVVTKADTLELTGQAPPAEAPDAPVVVPPAAALEQPGVGWRIGNWWSGTQVDTTLEAIDERHLDNPDLVDLAGRGLETVAAAAGVELERDGASLTLRAGSDSETYTLPSDPEALAGTVEEVLETLRRSSRADESWADVEANFIESLVPHLGPYAHFSPRQDRIPRSDFINGNGLNVRQGPNGTWFAMQPDPESPAAEAGITHGTRITAIGDLQLSEATPEQVSEALDSDSVSVTFQIGAQTRTAQLESASFRRDAVTLDDVDENGVGHIVITRFDRDVATQVREILDGADPPLRGVVLDLRGNSGGNVSAARELVGLFQERRPLYRLEEADGDRWVASPDGARYTDVPLAVLVDSETASAAEIVIGGLVRFPSRQEPSSGRFDENRAVVLGASTFGKATIQHTIGPLIGPRLTFNVGRVDGPFGHYEGRGYTPALCSGAVASGATDMGAVNAMIAAGSSCEHELRLGIPEDLGRARAILADPALLERALRNDASVGLASP